MEARNICKSYNGVTVLSDVSISVKKGETVLIKGASGIGKTTLLNIILGLTEPDSGSISDVPDTVSAVFQEDRMPPELTAAACVKMTAPKGTDKEQIVRHFEKAGLQDCADVKVKELSGGMRRRVSIVRAIICSADLVVLDEPFTGLDRESKLKAIEYIKEYTKDSGVIIVSHGEEDADLMNAKTVELR